MITTNNKISYFCFNFNRKSTYYLTHDDVIYVKELKPVQFLTTNEHNNLGQIV